MLNYLNFLLTVISKIILSNVICIKYYKYCDYKYYHGVSKSVHFCQICQVTLRAILNSLLG